MKNIGFVTSPLTSGHSPRGVGVYTQNLLTELKKLSSQYDLNIIELTSSLAHSQPVLDLIHYPFFDLFYATLPILKSKPTVVTIHDVTPLKYPNSYPPGIKGKLNFYRQLLALKSVDRVITDSRASVADLQDLLHLSQEQIRLTYLAVPTTYRPVTNQSVLHKITAKYHLPPKFILYVGDINYNKNLPFLIKICLNLQIPLVMVGKNLATIEHLDLSHPELRHLQKIIPFLSSPLIIRLGFIPEPDKITLYSLAILYCQPSLYEGFGFPVLEALSCGCPVVSSQIASLPEIAGLAAKYFDPSLPDAAQAVIAQVYNDQSLQKSLRQAGLIQARKFNWSKTAADTIRVYQELQ